jgi:AraC-like DNA-binding protein
MEPIPIFRGTHLEPHLGVLNQIGSPVETRLRKAKLPLVSSDRPGMHLPLPRVLDFLIASERSEGIQDLAVKGALALPSAQLEPGLRAALARAPTLHLALRAMCAFGKQEAPCVEWWTEGDAVSVKACSRTKVHRDVPGRHYAEWYQNLAWVTIVRAFAGPSWCPGEMGFESPLLITRFTQEQFPNTRFLSGQPNAWIDVPRRLLSRRSRTWRIASLVQTAATEGLGPVVDFPCSLKLLLKSYLAHGYPSVGLAAEVTGMSVRTLQRRLAAAGTSYSEVVDQARFEVAADLLKRPGLKLIDVAYDLGYEDPSSFTRAFRRIAGVSPQESRNDLIHGRSGLPLSPLS